MGRNDLGSDSHRYDDIIHLPRHISTTHPQMSIANRAAQFAPFAALTGHEAAVKETARLTDHKAELDENAKAILDERLRMVQEMLAEQPEVTITYFQADEKKDGGQYIAVTGAVKKLDQYRQYILMSDGLRIPFRDISDVEGRMFG